MKIRKELNKQLYRQKAYGYEKNPSRLNDAVLNAVLGGDIETLNHLISRGAITLPTDTRTLSSTKINARMENT